MTHLPMPWNEIEYVPWDRFRRMAPSILRLEISRLDELVRAVGNDLEIRNALVKVRYELSGFLVELDRAAGDRLPADAVQHLEAAIVNLPLDRIDPETELHAAVSYILDRLRSVHKRIDLIYR